MQKNASFLQHLEAPVLSTVFLALILVFTYAMLFAAPYYGFYFNPDDGEVWQIFVPASPNAALQPGDVITKIAGVPLSSYVSDRTIAFFDDVKAGETVEITVLRNGSEKTIPWVVPGFNSEEFKGRFINLWWLAYIFWAFGLLTQLAIRPRDARWRLLSIANYLMGFWIMVGSLSARQVWDSSLLLHAVTWLLLPVFLHLHWAFPRPLKNLPVWSWAILYLVSFLLAFGEMMQALPSSLYALGFLVMLLGSIALLITHAVRQPDQRRAVAILGITILLALIPVIILGISGLSSRIQQTQPLTLLILPIIPGAYFFIVYRQQLGGLEVRANRIFSIYAYLLLLGAFLLILLAPAALFPLPTGTLIVLALVAALFTAFVSILAFPAFQSFVDRRVLGIRLPYLRLPETFSSRITTSTSLRSLLQLLEEEIFPSLLVRQFVFMRPEGDSWEALLVKGIERGQLPNENQANELAARVGDRRLPAENFPLAWIRLVIPLKVGATVAGLWLLGRRDPDDAYHEAEIPVLQSLANQTAIAMSNLLQSERLQSLYRMDIDRREQERMHLALELHDSVLNQLAVLRLNADEPNLSLKFQQAYENVVQRLREIVSELRPPMLNYGLKLALEELIQDLAEQEEGSAKIALDMQGDDPRYPANIELHLYRIVQETCSNALRHARAAHIQVAVQMESGEIRIKIEDDGIGFPIGERLELNDLLAHKHFGLAGIVERARLIGAQASIQSNHGSGTRVQLLWQSSSLNEMG